MREIVRTLVGVLVSLAPFHVAAQQSTTSYNPSGGEMLFILMLVAFVIGGWVGYEWIRKNRSA